MMDNFRSAKIPDYNLFLTILPQLFIINYSLFITLTVPQQYLRISQWPVLRADE